MLGSEKVVAGHSAWKQEIWLDLDSATSIPPDA